jgi:lipopolysaccharide export system protein LptA
VKPVLVIGSCLLLASPVLAAPAQTKGAAKNEVQSAPVDIRSDHLTVHQKQQQAVFEGNVKTVQGDLEISCEKLTVTYSGEKDTGAKAGEVKQMVFTGSVSITQKNRRGHCERAVYDRVAGRIVCTGNSWVVEGENQIRGERIVYLLEEDEVRVTRPQAVIRLPEDGLKKGGLNK